VRVTAVGDVGVLLLLMLPQAVLKRTVMRATLGYIELNSRYLPLSLSSHGARFLPSRQGPSIATLFPV
jgi:hypothetical protein